MNDARPLPQFKEPYVAVTFATDENFIPYASVLLESLLENSSKERSYDIILMHPDFRDESYILTKLQNQTERYPNVSLRFLNITPFFKGTSLKGHSHISSATYYRLKIASLFENYQKILYLDVDMLIRQDIGDLYEKDLKNCLLGATRDLGQLIWIKKKKQLFYPFFKGNAQDYLGKYLGLSHPELYLQAGCLLLNLKKMREDEVEKQFFQLLWSKKPFHWMDQDILNIVFNSQEIAWIGQRWNFIEIQGVESNLPDFREEYEKSKLEPAVIHYASAHKPWQSKEGKFNLFWWEVAQKTPFRETIEERFQAYLIRPIPLKARIKSWLKDETALGHLAREIRQIFRHKRGKKT